MNKSVRAMGYLTLYSAITMFLVGLVMAMFGFVLWLFVVLRNNPPHYTLLFFGVMLLIGSFFMGGAAASKFNVGDEEKVSEKRKDNDQGQDPDDRSGLEQRAREVGDGEIDYHRV